MKLTRVQYSHIATLRNTLELPVVGKQIDHVLI